MAVTFASTATSARAWSPDVQGYNPADAIPDALIQQITTHAGVVEGDDVAVRVPFVDDDEAHIVPEGQQIPDTDPELAEAVIMTTKVAKLLRITREQFYQPQASTLLATASARSIIFKADSVLLNQPAPQSPAITPPAGLLNQGITDAGAVTTSLDGLVDALAAISANGGTPSHLVLAPTAWASLRKLKTGTGSAMTLLGAGVNDAVPMVMGVPVIVNKAMPANTGLAVCSNDIISVVGNVNVAQSDDVYFEYDSIGLRVTFRFGARIMHPDRHAKFTVTPVE